MDTLEAFISALPKVELHVHLVGSASVETVLVLARRHPDRGVPSSADGLREFYTFRDFPHFIDVYTAVSGLLTEPGTSPTWCAGWRATSPPSGCGTWSCRSPPTRSSASACRTRRSPRHWTSGPGPGRARGADRVDHRVPRAARGRPRTRRAAARADPPAGLVGFGMAGIEQARPHPPARSGTSSVPRTPPGSAATRTPGKTAARDGVGGDQVPARGADRARDQVARGPGARRLPGRAAAAR